MNNIQTMLKAGTSLLLTLALATSMVFVTAAQADSFRTVKGGVQVNDTIVGKGPVAETGMVATIHVTGWLDDQSVRGEQLYDTRFHGRPISFVIGTNKVMPAWNAGVLGMQAGGERTLLVPADMAYGNREIDDNIPANASLQLNIELVRLKE